MRRTLWALAGLAGLAVAGTVGAHVDVDPNKEYVVTPEQGPWLIRATVYVGPESRQLAHEMVMFIRQTHKLPAFVYSHTDVEKKKQDEETRQQREYLARLQQMYPENQLKLPVRHVRIEDQYVVLVGGYKDMDAANKALRDFKKLQEPADKRLLPMLTQFDLHNRNDDVKVAYANPFVTAYVVPNPAAPHERKVEETKNYRFLKKLNSGEHYSLLRCRKPYTLMVAAFQGLGTFEAVDKEPSGGFWDSVSTMWKNHSGDMLEASAQNAHNLGKILSELKSNRGPGPLFEDVYVLHMPKGSIVTVGGFDSADDPNLQAVRQRVQSVQQISPAGYGFMLREPVVILVPKP